MATLGKVQDILKGSRPAADVVVRIRSDEGTYYDQSVIWDYFNPDYGISFESYPDSLDALFRQGEADSAFFVLNASAGRPTNIHFRGLAIRGYAAGAIWFTGSRDESGWNGFNSITDCAMEDIGNEFQPERHLCWAVIDLVNSRHNVIEGCTFINCANANMGQFPQDTIGAHPASEPVLPIIGVYLAHRSGCNFIAGCTFRRFKGDAVRIRDASNENEICHNYFQQTGWTAVCTMWYLFPPLLKPGAGECPSWSNIFHHNRAEGNWLCGPSLLFYDMRPELGGRCPNPPDGGGYRVRMWDNETDQCKP